MENLLNVLDIKDRIFNKLQKTKALITCLIISTEFAADGIELDKTASYHVLETIEEQVNQILDLQIQLDNCKNLQA